jgi:HEAT repeat protein
MSEEIKWKEYAKLLTFEDDDIADTLGFTGYKTARRIPDSKLMEAARFFSDSPSKDAIPVLIHALKGALGGLFEDEQALHGRLIKPVSTALIRAGARSVEPLVTWFGESLQSDTQLIPQSTLDAFLDKPVLISALRISLDTLGTYTPSYGVFEQPYESTLEGAAIDIVVVSTILIKIGKQAIPPLCSMLRSDNRYTRWIAVRALYQQSLVDNTIDLKSLLQDALKDKDELVKQEAKKYIKRGFLSGLWQDPWIRVLLALLLVYLAYLIYMRAWERW